MGKLFVLPDVRRKRVTVRVKCEWDGDVTVSVVGGPSITVSRGAEIRLDFPDCDLWTPDAPTLYTLRCEFAGGGSSPETLECRFGMRECTVKDCHVTLNQQRVYVQGVNVSGAAKAGTGSTPVTAQDIEALKGSGFNALRFWAQEDVDAVLDASDALGLLVFLELDCESLDAQFDSLIPCIRNHPSLVAWVLSDGESTAWKRLRETDPSRLIIVEGRKGGDHLSPSFFVRPYKNGLEPFDPLEVAFTSPSERLVERHLGYMGEPDNLSLALRLGIDFLPSRLESEATEAESGEVLEVSRRLWASSEDCQVDAVRMNQNVAGYFLDRTRGLSDIEFGEPVAPRVRAQAPIRPVCYFPKRNLRPREEIPITVLLLNEPRLEGRADLSLQVVGPTQQVLWKKKRGIKIPRPGKELWSGSISASGSTGPHRFVVRLMKDMQCIAENSVEFNVFEPVKPWGGETHVLDPAGRWASLGSLLTSRGSIQSPVHIIPPLANTISGYPENDLAQILGLVKEGAVAIFFEPPDDWNDLAESIDQDLTASGEACSGASGSGFHMAKLHPVFDGLPAGELMGWTYRDLLPRVTFSEQGEEDICACMRLSEAPGGGLVEKGNDVLVHRYGSGRIVFTHMRLLDSLGANPVADRLFVNFLRHFSRRAVSSEGPDPIYQRTVEWLRERRGESARKWMVIGMFSNWGGIGHETVYPPEEGVDFEATYPGWYGVALWRPWYALRGNDFRLDVEEPYGRVNLLNASLTTGTGYAYAECTGDRRREGRLKFDGGGAVKIWFNGKLVYSRGEASEHGRGAEGIEIFLKQGRNTLLVKRSIRNLCAAFSVEIVQADETSDISWW